MSSPATALQKPVHVAAPSDARLIVQPGDSFFPIVDAIDDAREEIALTAFRLDCPVVRDALISARERGVRVTVLVSHQKRKWQARNRALLRELRRHGVRAARPRRPRRGGFRAFHYKLLTVDRRRSLIFTFNPTRENLHYSRDFGLEIEDPALAGEITRLLEADLAGRRFAAELPYLAISPDDSRGKFEALFESAQQSIHLFDSRVRDRRIRALLERRADEGIDVRVIGSARNYGARSRSTIYRRTRRFEVHAKAGIVDGRRFYLGSTNLRPTGLDGRRELSIFAEHPVVAAALEKIFLGDWQGRHGTQPAAETIEFPAGSDPALLRARSDEHRFLLVSTFDASHQIRFSGGTLRIGRDPDNDVVIPHPSVSRQHARIRCRGRLVQIEDLGTANGTSVNHKRIRRRWLKWGDLIRIAEGDEFRFIAV